MTYLKGQRKYRRQLGQAAAPPSSEDDRYMAGFQAAYKGRKPNLKVDDDPAARIEDMDFEGVDVNLTLPSGWLGTWTLEENPAIETAMYRAYHQWMDDYCGAYPDRLGGLILLSSRDIEGGLKEIEKMGQIALGLGHSGLCPGRRPARPSRHGALLEGRRRS